MMDRKHTSREALDETAETTGTRTRTEGEIRVPVTEETARVQKVQREAGHVGITKNVETETRHIAEPVTQTKVSVHTREIPDGEAYTEREGVTHLNTGETLRVPITQEQLVVEKQARVAREVVVNARPETEMVERDVDLRRERVDVHPEGEIEEYEADDVTARRR